MEPYVFAFAFQINDVADAYQRRFIIGFDRDILPVARGGFRGRDVPLCLPIGQQFIQRLRFGYRTVEIGEAERFEQVVDRIEFESLDGVFRICRREDNHRAADERPYELYAAQIGHVDIHENQVDRISGQILLGFDGVGERFSSFRKLIWRYNPVIAAVPAARRLWRYISAWHDGDYEFDGINGRIGIVDSERIVVLVNQCQPFLTFSSPMPVVPDRDFS